MEISICIVMLLQTWLVYGDIKLGIFQKGKQNNAAKLLTLDKMGPQMCAKRCLYHKSCKSFNYHRSHLVCDLLGDEVSMDSNDTSVSFSNIASWALTNDVCYPNPCKEGEVCVNQHNGKHFCRRFTSFCSNTELVCLNGGTCSNELSSAVCRCPTGYDGPVCEFITCEIYSCNERGTCVPGTPTPTCNCDAGYSGNNCESCGFDNGPASDCIEVYSQGFRCSGVYNIVIAGVQKQVWCDHDNNRGGNTVIQRRQDGSVDFDVGWNDYKNGFGNASQEYWIGNDALHALTFNSNVFLLILMETWDGTLQHAYYSSFRVNDESDKYRLTISGYLGDSGNGLLESDGQMFSTKDQDNDGWSTASCSTDMHSGGWWYNSCSDSALNGVYYNSSFVDDKSCFWSTRKESLKTVSMMIKKN